MTISLNDFRNKTVQELDEDSLMTPPVEGLEDADYYLNTANDYLVSLVSKKAIKKTDLTKENLMAYTFLIKADDICVNKDMSKEYFLALESIFNGKAIITRNKENNLLSQELLVLLEIVEKEISELIQLEISNSLLVKKGKNFIS